MTPDDPITVDGTSPHGKETRITLANRNEVEIWQSGFTGEFSVLIHVDGEFQGGCDNLQATDLLDLIAGLLAALRGRR